MGQPKAESQRSSLLSVPEKGQILRGGPSSAAIDSEDNGMNLQENPTA